MLKLQFPLWQYLNQPLFHIACPLILNPRRYSYYYRVALLERCLMQGCESQEHRD
ncbi:hypothetical protein H6F89_14895 [Cyanobacteria bacterium FACHB-63]|nr:hypothetical protein [Cyanobacteria bacterium FACHB-63]